MTEEPKQIEEKVSPEAWQASYDRARELIREVMNELPRAYGSNYFAEWQKIMDGIGKLAGKEYAAWHGAIGSTTDLNLSPYADLPNEKSVIKYLERSLAILKDKSQNVQK